MSVLPISRSLLRGWAASRVDPARLRRLQEAKLRRILAHAYATVPFYRRLWDRAGIRPADIRTLDDLAHLPVVTKAQLQRAGEEARTSRAWPRSALLEKRTSGSTGRPMTLVHEPTFEAAQKAVFLRALAAGGLRPWHRLLLVTGVPGATRRGPPGWRYVSSEAPPGEVLAALDEHRPQALYGFLTPLRQLADLVRARERRPRLAAVFATAETLDSGTRALLAGTFGAEIFDIYGCTEVGPIAWECRAHQGYHVAADAVLVECGGEPGADAIAGDPRVVITSLELMAMPLVRYEVGDLAVPASADPCACGSRLPRLARVEGRLVDCVRLADGRLLSPYHLTLALEQVAGVDRYQIVQLGLARFLVRAEASGRADPGVAAALRDALRREVGEDATVEVAWEDDLEPAPGRKFRVVESRLGREAMPCAS